MVNDSRCTTRDAKRYVSGLIGDTEARAPTKDGRGRPFVHYFLSLSSAEAKMEYHQIEQLPEGYREDDLRYRMDVEGML